MLVTTYGVSSTTQSFGLVYTHPALLSMLPVYSKLRDCLENRVKAQKTAYLPDPSEVRENEELREARYKNYWKRAVWMPVTKRTVQGLTSQVYIKRPQLVQGSLPQSFIDSPSMLGDSLDGFARYCLSENIGLGRGVVVAHITDTGMPMLDCIEAENIVTWSDLPYGYVDGLGRNIESVTLRSFFTVTQDDMITIERFSVLTQYKIDADGNCWLRSSLSSFYQTLQWGAWQPIIVRGKPLTYVPVFPFGAERNNLSIQQSPIEELADLNISHYINSADYEEHAKVAGQVTPVITGLNQEWYDRNIKGQIAFGVRSPLPLPAEADAKLLQAQANSVAKEALDKKEQMMISVGARLIEQRMIRRTATEADIEDQAYHSILGHIAQNTSDAVTGALRHISRYYTENGDADTSILYAMNTDFSGTSSSPDNRRLLLEEYLAGARSFSEYRKALQQFDQTVTLSDAQAKTAIQADLTFRQTVNTALGVTPSQVPSGDNRTSTAVGGGGGGSESN